MPELLDEASSLESTTVGVFRTSATIKGGRRFSFNALVVVGDRRGRVALGYGKAREVPAAVEKAQKEARKRLQKVTLLGGTIPHEVTGRFGAAIVRLIPAAPGTGVVAGNTVRSVLELVGITDCLTKCFGSTNQQNTTKATLVALGLLRTRDEVAAIRGVTLDATDAEVKVEKGKALMPASPREKTMKAPVSLVAKKDEKGGRGGRRGGPGRGRPGAGRPSGGEEEGGAPAPAGGEDNA
ncbi:MAG: 30S ribosomal protein S5 [Phycisphaerales bacterium]